MSKECICPTEDVGTGEHMHEIPTTLVQDGERFWGEDGKELTQGFLTAWADAFNSLNTCINLFFIIYEKMVDGKEEQEKKLTRNDYVDYLHLPDEAYRFLYTYEPIWKEWVTDEEEAAILAALKERMEHEEMQKKEYN